MEHENAGTENVSTQIADALRQVKSIGNTRDLYAFESVLRDDPFADEADWAVVFGAIARRESQLQAREDEGKRFQRQQSQKEMLAALSDLNVKGSGITVKRRNNRGRLVSVRGVGFSVPSGSSVSLSSEGEGDNDALMPGLNQFLNRYIKPNMSGNYADPGSSLVDAKTLTNDEVIDKLGIVPPDAGRLGLEQLLMDAAADGTLSAGDIDAFAAQNKLPKSVASRAKGLVRTATRREAAESPAVSTKKAMVPKALKPAKNDASTGAGKQAASSESEILAQMIKSGRTDFGTPAFARDFDAAVRAAQPARSQPAPSGAGSSGPPPPIATQTTAAGAAGDSSKRQQTEAARKQAEGRKELDAVMAASHRSGVLSDDDYEAFLSSKAFDGQIPSSERRSATGRLGSLGAKRVSKDERDKAQEAREDKRASDFAKKTLAGAQAHEAQETEKATARPNLSAFGRTGTLAALGVLHGITAAFASGREMGNAAGALVSGLSRAFTGAASGFIGIGTGMLSLVLSPFGRSGEAVAKLAGGLGQSLVSALSAGGAIVAAGVKVGVGLTTGILAGLTTLSAAGIGGVIGGILGSVLPGGGTVAGAWIGAGIGSTIAGSVLQALAGIAGSVSSALGAALSAVGDAFGKVGSAIGDALSTVKNVLSDLIETGVKLGQTSLSTQRQSGMSGQASSDATSLSQILTGGPGAFSGMFGNVGMMQRYMDARATTYGAPGTGSFVDNLPGLYKRYQQFGDGPNGSLERRVMLSIVAPGAQGPIGDLFSLGGGAVSRAVQVAKQTALTPKENLQNAMLGFDLNVVQAQLDRLKTKLLSDLMPAITTTVNVFSKWFTGHEGQIVSGLESFGKWLYVKLPTYVQMGANAFFELGKSLALSLPAVAEFGKTVYSTFANITNGLKTGFGILLTTAGLVLTALSGALSMSPLTSWASPGLMKAGVGLTKSGAGLTSAPGLDPHGADKLFDKLGAASPGLVKSIQGAQDKTNKFLGGAFGTEAEREAGWKRNGPQGGIAAPLTLRQIFDLHLTGDLRVHPDEDSFHRFERRVGDSTIKRIVRADQRS